MKRAAAVVACALACATWPAVAVPAAPAGAPAPAAALAAIDPDRAREQARDVLAQRRFQSNELPSPLRRVRERIGDALRQAGRPFESVYNWVAGWFPGGPPVLITLLAGAILAGTAALVTRSAARRRQAGAGAGGALALGADAARQPSAAHLRRQADDAERRGDLDAALRLRFRAGLVDLHARELIELRPALTNHELLRAVPSATLADLVDGFEAVAYGGRDAAGRGRRPRPRRLAARRRGGGHAMSRVRRWLPRTTAARVIAGVVAFLVALNLVALVISFLRPEPSGAEGSAYATQPRGAAAYAELLRRAGHPVDYLREPLAEARLERVATLVVLDAPRLDADERAALGRFVRGGGRLVVGGPLAGRGVVPRPPLWVPAGPRTARPNVAVPETTGLRSVVSAGEGGFGELGGAQPALGDAPALLAVAGAGRGRALLLADSSPLQNRLLARADNAALGLALAGPAGPARHVRRVRPRLRPRHRPGGDPGALALRARVRRAGRPAVAALARPPPRAAGAHRRDADPGAPRARRGARARAAPRARRRRRARAGAGRGPRPGHPARGADARRARRRGARRRAAARLRGR